MSQKERQASIHWDGKSHAFIVTTPPNSEWQQYDFQLSVQNASELLCAMLKSWPSLAHVLVEESRAEKVSDSEFLIAAGITREEEEQSR